LATAHNRPVTNRFARAADAPGTAQYGFERMPVFGLSVAMIAALAAPALGPLALLVQIAGVAAIFVTRWRSLPAWLPLAFPLMLLPLFAAASALWSDVPGISLRYGVQLLVTVLMGVMLGRALTLRQLVLAVFIGLTIAGLAGLASGRMGVAEEGPVLIGLSGSKNQMGYIALFWLAAALCVAGSSGYRLMARIAAMLAVVPAVFLIAQGDSATALVSAVLLVGVLVMLLLASWLGRGGRLFALAAAALMVIPTIVALPEIERQAAILQTDVLKKDARLTGRTLLWEEADRLIAQSPVIGHGYKAIWLGSAGKGLLARNNQSDGRAFHFHDTFRELLADLGIVGLALFLLPLAYAAVRLVVLLVAAIDAPRAFAAASLFTILLRIRTELVIAPFMLDTALLMAIVTALAVTPIALRDPSGAHPARARTPRALPPRGRRAHRHLSHPQRNPA
jgi:exopolysaccharide production protein ExoQ